MNNRFSILFLVFSLFVISGVIISSNIADNSNSKFWYDSLNLIFTSILLIVCIINNFKIGTSGKHGKAWLFFTLAISFWYVAERIWALNDLSNFDFPITYADVFWFSGYVFYFLFGVMYLKPFASKISRKNIVLTTFSILAVLIFTFYITPSGNIFENIVNMSYPVTDAIMLIPSILGMILFFKGRITFSWSLFFFGMIVFVASDYGFMYFNSISEYYEGHLIDIPYLWAYSIFTSGIISTLALWKKIDKNKPFNDQNNLR